MKQQPVPSRRWFEPALGAVLACVVVLELAGDDLLHTWVEALLAVGVGLPVALRFRAPLFAVLLTGTATVALSSQTGDDGQLFAPVICLLVILYAVGSRRSGLPLVAGGVLGVVLIGAAMVVDEGFTDDLALAVAMPGVGLLIGRAAGVLQLETDVLETRAALLEEERDEHTRAAVSQERSRIARELHDVIGHSISVMGLQAGAVRSVLPADRAEERAVLLTVERTGREAVGEMHRLIGLLRPDADAAATPRSSLARVETLAEDMRAAGQRLTLTVDGDVAHLPAGVDLAGYRIVQEALTNALKHAPGAAVDARVSVEHRVLELDIVDDGTDARARSNGRVGHGLLGMRERAVLYGGEVTAAPRRGGGFRVHARLPVEVA